LIPGIGARQFLIFRLGSEEYGFEVGTVREIHRLDSVTTVHRSAPYIEGVMNLRGKLVTVINLRKRFGMEPAGPECQPKIIVVDALDAPVGYLVDEVVEVARFNKEDIEKPPPYVAKGAEALYVLGIAKQNDRLVTIIDPLKILDLSSESVAQSGGTKLG